MAKENKKVIIYLNKYLIRCFFRIYRLKNLRRMYLYLKRGEICDVVPFIFGKKLSN